MIKLIINNNNNQNVKLRLEENIGNKGIRHEKRQTKDQRRLRGFFLMVSWKSGGHKSHQPSSIRGRIK